jgi:oxalate decarboxylase/phosphoglucose isomerase-like protein (cupin superfamily)
MPEPIAIDLQQMNWAVHPTLAGVETKFFQNSAGHSPQDVLLARVGGGEVIAWHVHLDTCEIAYVLQGQGQLLYAAHEDRQDMGELEFEARNAYIIPPGLWHSVHNSGDEPMLIFALHTK